MNEKYPTIKFTAEWSQTSINFLAITVSIIGGRDATDLYVKPTDSHQYLCSSSQAFRLKRICADPNSFDRICDDLEKWPIERGYSDSKVSITNFKSNRFYNGLLAG